MTAIRFRRRLARAAAVTTLAAVLALPGTAAAHDDGAPHHGVRELDVGHEPLPPADDPAPSGAGDVGATADDSYDVLVLANPGCETQRWTGVNDRSLTHALTTEPGAKTTNVATATTATLAAALASGDHDVFAVPSFCARTWVTGTIADALAAFVTAGGIAILGDPIDFSTTVEPLVASLPAAYSFSWTSYDHCGIIPTFPFPADPIVNTPNTLVEATQFGCDHNTVDPATLGSAYDVGMSIAAQSGWTPTEPHALTGRAVGPDGRGAVVFDAHHHSHPEPDFHLLFENLVYLTGSLGAERPEVAISGAPTSVQEGGSFTLTVTADAAPVAATSVEVTLAGTTDADDFGVEITSVTIPAEATSGQLVVPVRDDGVAEPTETATISIATGASYDIGSPSSIGITVTDAGASPPGPGPTPRPRTSASVSGWKLVDGEVVRVPAPNPPGHPAVSVEPARDGGAWGVTEDGTVFVSGAAQHLGDASGHDLAAPIVSITSTPSGDGYYLVGADGGVFAFGDAAFHGSLSGIALNAAVVSMTMTCTGDGYWLVGADGGVFAFGDATFHGSMATHRLNAPMLGLLPMCDGRGYWLFAADGGVFTFGSLDFAGSLGSQPPLVGVVAILPDPDGFGYHLVHADGKSSYFGGSGSAALRARRAAASTRR